MKAKMVCLHPLGRIFLRPLLLPCKVYEKQNDGWSYSSRKNFHQSNLEQIFPKFFFININII